MTLDDELFNLKFTAKQLAKESARLEKEEKKSKAAVKVAIQNVYGDSRPHSS